MTIHLAVVLVVLVRCAAHLARRVAHVALALVLVHGAPLGVGVWQVGDGARCDLVALLLRGEDVVGRLDGHELTMLWVEQQFQVHDTCLCRAVGAKHSHRGGRPQLGGGARLQVHAALADEFTIAVTELVVPRLHPQHHARGNLGSNHMVLQLQGQVWVVVVVEHWVLPSTVYRHGVRAVGAHLVVLLPRTAWLALTRSAVGGWLQPHSHVRVHFADPVQVLRELAAHDVHKQGARDLERLQALGLGPASRHLRTVHALDLEH